VTKAHKEDGDMVHASAGTRQGGGMSALLCICTIIVVRLVGPGRPSREKVVVSVSREGRVQVQRLGCKRGRWQAKKNEKMSKHTSLAAYHFLPNPPNAMLDTMLDAMSCGVLEVAMRQGGWWQQTRKHKRQCDSEVAVKKMLMKCG